MRIQLGRDVVAQPLWIQAHLQVPQRIDAGAAALGHLLPAHGDEPVHVHPIGNFERRPGELQHRGPEQRVEVDDVLADEVNLLGGRITQQGLEVQALARAVRLQTRQIADRRLEPDVEELARRVGYRNAEIRRIARDVPVREPPFAFEPFAGLVGDLRLQPRALRPLAQKIRAAWIGEHEEVMLRGSQFRLRTRQHRIRILQLGRRIHGAAHFTGIPVLVGRSAARALALHVAVGQEHALDRIEQLLDRADRDQLVLAQAHVDSLGQLGVLRRFGRVPMVEPDLETLQRARAVGSDLRDELLGRHPGLLGRDHDGRAVGVVGADEVDRVALHPLETDPDVGLDVLHDVADVQRAVGVRQRGRDEQFAQIHRGGGRGTAKGLGLKYPIWWSFYG